MEHWKSTSMLNAVETHENHQHPHKSKETCCHYANSHEDDDDENSDYSEYSDSEDVPSENKYGYNIWDYFYILKSDVVKGLDKCGMIFRKENKMLRRFERHGNEQFTFLPTNKYGIYMEEKKKQYLKVKAEIIYKSNKSHRLVKVKLMNIAEIEEQRVILQTYIMKKNPNLILSYKATKAEKLRRMHRQRSTQ